MKNYDINYAEPEKNQFTGLKRAEIIEIAQKLISDLQSHNEDVVNAAQRVSLLSWELNMAQETVQRYTVRHTEMEGEIASLRNDRQVAEGIVTALDERDAVLSDVLEDASQATPALMAFTVRTVSDILGGEVTFTRKRKDTYRVILLDCRLINGRSPRIGCIKTLRHMKTMDLKEAVDLVNPAYSDPPKPAILASGLTQDEADRWEKMLKENAPLAKVVVEVE
jgi:ribosomal protein L7/L12